MIWVDVLVDRDQVQDAVRQLAQARIIELRPYDRGKPPFEIAHDPRILQQLLQLQDRVDQYQAYLPQPRPDAANGEPATAQPPTGKVLPELRASIENWLQQAQPLIGELENTGTESERLQLLAKCIDAVGEENLDLEYFRTPPADSNVRYVPIVVLGKSGDEAFFSRSGDRSMFQSFVVQKDPEQVVFIGFADSEAISDIEQTGHARGAKFARVPDLIGGPPPAARQQVQKLIEENQQKTERLRDGLRSLDEQLGFGERLWLLQRHIWMQQVLEESLIGTRFVWLGGWIVASRYSEMVELLEKSGISFLINRDETSDHGEPPIQLLNPAWVRMFEIFARGFGMPSRNEIDPSPLLAVTTPLMFGYMFGDIGQGLIIVAAGLLLRRRYEITGLLVPAGLASMVFGVLFGSIFGNEHLLPALWLHPMEHPMTLLLAPLVFGFLFIVTGMALAGIQAHWARGGRQWWRHELPVMAMYVSVVLALWNIRLALGIAAMAALSYLFFIWLDAYRQFGAVRGSGQIVAALFELLETLVQLIINTISFARLGAFALAHAGLNSAVITLGEIPSSKWLGIIILVLGNLLVIALEGLVVSIQTTRLVMFEFFRRFYSGGGRSFRPLALPETHSGGQA